MLDRCRHKLAEGTLLFLVSMLLSIQVNAERSPHKIDARLNLIANHQTSGETWLAGGLGRFGYGDEAHDIDLAYELHTSYRYRPLPYLQFKAYLQAQNASSQSSARELGIVELNAQYTHAFNFDQEIKFTLGQFFFPISMENVERFWETPYTITFSSLNSWIGEEFRPIGIDLDYRHHLEDGARINFSATPFWGNDSMGALLAFRGWSYGRLRTSYNDKLALPDLNSLAPGEPFEKQRDDGTKPFGSDLDGRPGYALRTGYLSDSLAINLSWIDNQGDTTLIEGEYAWRTKFAILGASWLVNEQFEVIAEASSGSSTMGAEPGVDIDFYSGYVMGSYLFNDYRISARYDQFGINDQDDIDDDSDEIGRSYTLALMWTEPATTPNAEKLSVGGEVLYLNSKRSRALDTGETATDSESFSFTLLMSYRF